MTGAGSRVGSAPCPSEAAEGNPYDFPIKGVSGFPEGACEEGFAVARLDNPGRRCVAEFGSTAAALLMKSSSLHRHDRESGDGGEVAA